MCIRHDFRLVNIRYYFTGEPVPEGKPWGDGKSEWKTVTECKVCGYVLEVPEFYKLKIKDERTKV